MKYNIIQRKGVKNMILQPFQKNKSIINPQFNMINYSDIWYSPKMHLIYLNFSHMIT